MKTPRLTLCLIALSLLTLGCSSSPDAPPPEPSVAKVELPADWPSQVQPGTEARYETSLAEGSLKLGFGYTVTSKDEQVIAYTEAQRMGERVVKQKERSVKVADWDLRAALDLSPETELVAKGSESIKVGERMLECSIVEFSKGKSTCRVWISKEVPAVFKGGLVRAEEREGDAVQIVNLVSLDVQ